MTEMYQYGTYTCIRCKKDYIVNDGTWRRCTPDYCHDCVQAISNADSPPCAKEEK